MLCVFLDWLALQDQACLNSRNRGTSSICNLALFHSTKRYLDVTLRPTPEQCWAFALEAFCRQRSKTVEQDTFPQPAFKAKLLIIHKR